VASLALHLELIRLLGLPLLALGLFFSVFAVDWLCLRVFFPLLARVSDTVFPSAPPATAAASSGPCFLMIFLKLLRIALRVFRGTSFFIAALRNKCVSPVIRAKIDP
jgi:hypothetical protein